MRDKSEAIGGKGKSALLEQRTDAELVALTWRNNTTSTFLSPLIYGCILLALYGRVAPGDLWIWGGGMGGILIVRFAILFAWKTRKPGLESQMRWGWYYMATMIVSMAAWGSLAPLFVHQLDPLGQAFVFATVVGLVGASISQSAMRRLTVLLVPSAAMAQALATCLLVGGDAMLSLAGLSVIYWVYLTKVGWDHHKTQREAMWLRFERAAMAEDLRAARDAAEQANTAKSAFLANVSHELRTPLNAVIGFSEMIKLGILGRDSAKRQVEYAGMIHDSGRHLLDLINDLLDLSKAEAGQLTLQEESVSLNSLVESCIALLSPAADQAGITIKGAAGKGPAGSGDYDLLADERKMRQVLLNLLSNAMKFTPPGGTVGVACDQRADGSLAVTVTDTGAGMTQQDLELAMLPFVQVGDVYNKQAQGTGLGLPLTKQLVELHGGRLDMKSAPGQGTQATVILPRKRISARMPAARAIA